MTCEEFERALPELEGVHSLEQEAHLQSCPACSDLVLDLSAISVQARQLEASDEPSPRIWNSIEITLRHEGLIGQTPRQQVLRPVALGWRLRWLVPAAAVLLLAVGVLVSNHGTGGSNVAFKSSSISNSTGNVAVGSEAALMTSQDQQLLNTVAARMPSMRDAYEANLRTVNAYVRDAEQSAHGNPNDEVSQQYLMNAYEQRAMVYEMALDRSLP
jgi:hypothetical protein